MRINSLRYAVLFTGLAAIVLLYDTAVSAQSNTAPTAPVQPSSPTQAVTDSATADSSRSPFLSATLIWCGALFFLLQGALITLLVFGYLRRRRLSKALKASEKRFQDFASISPDWFWEVDTEHKLTYLSDRYENVTGQPVAAQPGDSYLRFEALSWNRDRADVWEAHRETLKARESFRDFEYAALGANGEPCFRRISGTPIFEEDVFKGYRGTGTDITEERDRQAQLLKTIYEADHANRAKSAFLANMSHELRTPLNAIIGFSEILTDQLFGKMQNDRYLEYAKDINDTGQHLLTVLNDLLDISRIEAGFLTLDENVIDVQRMMRSCARMLNEKISAAQLTLSLDIPEDFPAFLGDETRLRQVVINLLTNAVKFTPSGGKISVSVNTVDDGGLEITVEDTGVGISAKDLERVMEPFQQAEQDLSRRYGGVGLGLSLARNLTELHDGTIKLESEPGVGTLVRVHLPADRVRAYPVQDLEKAPGPIETLAC
ncbi:PAS domain-containing sensor histidine kinase [Nisaea nitritireducens]|uniref:PAS domain-containing sensor histidine kinase n=1 Tax=Nisaea nitritireducens TaxID=568392 RepID=UPI0018680B8D|nr:PAS domain-containing protein [Nisaea nitritireducens]